MELIILDHSLVEVASLVAYSSEAIEFSIDEVALLNLVTVKDDTSDSVRNLRSSFELADNDAVVILDLLELNVLAVEVVVLLQL